MVAHMTVGASPPAGVARIGAAVYSPRDHTLTVAGKAHRLTPAQELLLAALLEHPGEYRTPPQLLQSMYGRSDAHELNVIAVMVQRLRAILGESAVENLRARGYRLCPEGLEVPAPVRNPLDGLLERLHDDAGMAAALSHRRNYSHAGIISAVRSYLLGEEVPHAD